MRHRSPDRVPSQDLLFNAYFERHVSAAYSSAVRRLGNDHADDIVTEAFTLAWGKQVHLFDEAKGRAWLLTTVAYLCMNWQRAATRELSKAKEASYLAAIALDQPTAVNEVFWQAWSKLRSQDQDLLSSVYWDEIAYSDLARIHRSSEGAVRTRVSRARSRFLKLLKPESVPNQTVKGAKR